jgi:hypothetical protein
MILSHFNPKHWNPRHAFKLALNILKPTDDQFGFNYDDLNKLLSFKIYILSCFLYAFIGIIKYNSKDKIYGIMLVIQSILSYMSDVKTLGIKSLWHPIDRYFASVLCLYHVTKNRTKRDLIINTILFSFSIKYLNTSKLYYKKYLIEFLFYHILWHITSSIMLLY